MNSLSQRSYQAELMDGNDIPFADMAQTLKELNTINTWLGGHAITLKGLKKIAGKRQALHICEVGCGGGDNLAAIENYYKHKQRSFTYTGIDINPDCIAYAKKQYPHLPCNWVCSDYATVVFENKPDIIFSSLFCHHFTNEQLTGMLSWKKENSSLGFFINDLHRHWLAKSLIKHITRFFSKSYLIKNDAPLSVARSFKKLDWEMLLNQSGVSHATIEWQWAFRYLITCQKHFDNN